jgi:hypothetical protein
MKSPDPNASNASDQQGKPTRFSRRQLLAGTPLAALGVAVSGLNLGSVTSSAAAESTEKKNSEEAPVDSSRRSEAKEEELDDFMFDIEKDGKGWTDPGGSAKEASVAEFPLSQSIAGVSMRLNPSGFRELHWHAIAAEWAYVLEGHVPRPSFLPMVKLRRMSSRSAISGISQRGMATPLNASGTSPAIFCLVLIADTSLNLAPSALRTG